MQVAPFMQGVEEQGRAASTACFQLFSLVHIYSKLSSNNIAPTEHIVGGLDLEPLRTIAVTINEHNHMVR